MSEALLQEQPVAEQPIGLEITEESKPTSYKEDPKVTEAFGKLAKQENHLRSERQKIEEAKKAFESERIELQSFKELQKLKDSDPLAMLEKLGITYDQITQAALDKSRPGDPLARKAMETVKKLEQTLAAKEQALAAKEQENQSANLRAAEVQLMSDIASTIKSKEMDVLDELDAHNTVREYMEEMYAQTGEVPNMEESCRAVANHILSLHDKVSNSKYFKSAKKEPAAETKQEAKEPSSTISQKLSSETAQQHRPITDAERMQLAVQAMMAVKSK